MRTLAAALIAFAAIGPAVAQPPPPPPHGADWHGHRGPHDGHRRDWHHHRRCRTIWHHGHRVRRCY